MELKDRIDAIMSPGLVGASLMEEYHNLPDTDNPSDEIKDTLIEIRKGLTEPYKDELDYKKFFAETASELSRQAYLLDLNNPIQDLHKRRNIPKRYVDDETSPYNYPPKREQRQLAAQYLSRN